MKGNTIRKCYIHKKATTLFSQTSGNAQLINSVIIYIVYCLFLKPHSSATNGTKVTQRFAQAEYFSEQRKMQVHCCLLFSQRA